jgi:protein TonB
LLGAAWAQEQADAPFVPPSWINRPHDADLHAHFPLQAQHARVNGRVELSCIIQLDTTLDCTVATEEPTGYGFGDAALRVSETWRINPATRDGVPIEGVRLNVPLRFRWD